MSAKLAERLRNETRFLHTQAERSAFMARLLRGEMDRVAYIALLRNLHAIYSALEPALRRHAAHPAITALELPALARTGALAADLDALGAPVAVAGDDLEPSCRLYLARLDAIDASEPSLLLAHAYVRYLGDLSGGQILGQIVARSLGSAGAGTAFYDFGGPAGTASLASSFRAGLDAADVDDDAIVAEAKQAFAWHRTLFDELARSHGIAA